MKKFKSFDVSNVDFTLISKFLESPSLDNNLILLNNIYVARSRENFQHLVSELLNIVSVGFDNLTKESNKAWNAIECVLCLFSQDDISDDIYFCGTWKAFSILISNFERFDKHSLAIQNAYLKFEKIFSKKREEFLNNDYWFTQTDHDWWIKVNKFFESRNL